MGTKGGARGADPRERNETTAGALVMANFAKLLSGATIIYSTHYQEYMKTSEEVVDKQKNTGRA